MAADRSVFVRLRASVGDYVRGMGLASAATGDLEGRLRRLDTAGNAIDRTSGRVGLLVDALLAVGPAAIPITATAVPALTVLSQMLGSVALGAGTTILAFGGVGDALDAMNKAHLEPTKENLKEAEKALDRLAPAAEDFVRKLDSLRGLGADLRDTGAQALFPGLIDALDALEERAPDAMRIIRRVNREVGDIARDSARDLASDRWDDFFRMLRRESPRTLDSLATSLGNVAHGTSEIMEAFVPLNRDGMGWLEDATGRFDKWATGLKKTEGFEEFVDYIRENGPQVADTLGSIADAGLQIAEAVSPLGGPALKGIEGVADAIAKVADSGVGTELFAGLATYRLLRRIPRGPGGMPGLGGGGGGGGVLGGGGVVPVFVTNPGFGTGVPGVPGAAPGAPSSTKPGKVPPGTAARTIGGSLLGKLPFVPLLATGLTEGLDRIGLSNDGGDDNPFTFKIKGLDGQLGDFIRGGGFGSGGGGASTSVGDIAGVNNPGSLVAGVKLEVDETAAADFDAKLEAITSKPYKASVELEDQRARRVADGVHRMLDDVASQRPTPKIDADEKPAKTKMNWVDSEIQRLTGKTAKPKVDADDKASGILNRVSGLLSSLDGRRANTTVTTTYVTRRINEGNVGGATNLGPQAPGVAGGGTILPGGRVARHAQAGATVPDDGGGYRDYYPFLLAPREEVVSDMFGGASRNRSELKAASRGAKLAVVGYAGGGTAGYAPDRHLMGGSSRVSFAPALVEIRDPWGGRQQVELRMRGIAREEARHEIDAQDRWEGGLDR